MIPKSGRGFRKRSCSTKRLERDDDSKKSHHALRGAAAKLSASHELPLARQFLGFSDLLARQLVRHDVATVDGGSAVARIRCWKLGNGKVEPHVRHHSVLLDTLAFGGEEAEVVLGVRVMLVGGAAIPSRRFRM